MNLRSYKAYSMAEALAAVKRDLGADAVILNTRSYRSGGIFGIGRQSFVEVTATSAPASSPGGAGTRQVPASQPAPHSRAAARAYSSAGSMNSRSPAPDDAAQRKKHARLVQAMLQEQAARGSMAGEESEERGKGGIDPRGSANEARGTFPSFAVEAAPPAQRKVHRVQVEMTAAASMANAGTPGAGAQAAPGPERSEQAIAPSAQAGAPRAASAQCVPSRAGTPAGARENPNVAQRFILTPAARDGHAPPAAPDPDAAVPEVPTSQAAAAVSTADRRPVPLVRATDEKGGDDTSGRDEEGRLMRDELNAIRQMVGEVLQRQVTSRGIPSPTMPPKLFDLYLKLIGQDLSEELADRIINDVRDDLDGGGMEDEHTLREAVRRHLADYIPTAEQAIAMESPDDRPLTIALVGPTGVGKTTTLAKLAASFKLRHRQRVGLITADTYRIAAVDQLRTYANIIGVPLQVVLTPGEMRQAVHALQECDVILIDTAGRGQNDHHRLDELRQIIDSAEPHEVHLVLSSTAGEKVLMREAEAFSAVGVDKVVLTKLDEAVSFGVLINVARQLGKQLSFFTTGQEVPDHIEVSDAQRLAEAVLSGGIDL